MAVGKASSVSDQQLANFVRQLQVMLESGIGIIRALDFFATTDSTELGQAIEDCTLKVRQGNYLSQALKGRPDIFSEVFIGLLQVGERSGGLVRMMEILAQMLERQSRIQARIKNALIYPAFLLAISLVVGILFTYSILPTMEPMLASVHVGVPWPTRALLSLGQAMRNPIVVVAVIALVVEIFLHGPVLLARLREEPERRAWIDGFPFRLPAVGMTYRQILLARVMFTLSACLEVGMTIPEALHLSEKVADNYRVVLSLRRISDRITEGDSLSQAMSADELFPTWIWAFVSLGEEAASLPHCMRCVAQLNEENAEHFIDISAQLLEPFLLCSITVGGGFLTVACMAPIVAMLRSL